MTEIQKMKMELLDKFGIVDDPKSVDFCREAYKFLAEGDTTAGIDPAHQEINPLNWKPPYLQRMASIWFMRMAALRNSQARTKRTMFQALA